MWHKCLHEEVELVPLEDLLEVHLRQHHAMRPVLGRVVKVAQPLVLRGKGKHVRYLDNQTQPASVDTYLDEQAEHSAPLLTGLAKDRTGHRLAQQLQQVLLQHLGDINE